MGTAIPGGGPGSCLPSPCPGLQACPPEGTNPFRIKATGCPCVPAQEGERAQPPVVHLSAWWPCLGRGPGVLTALTLAYSSVSHLGQEELVLCVGGLLLIRPGVHPWAVTDVCRTAGSAVPQVQILSCFVIPVLTQVPHLGSLRCPPRGLLLSLFFHRTSQKVVSTQGGLILPLMLKGGSVPPRGLWPGLQEGVAPQVWSDYSCHLLPQNLQCGQHMLLPWSHCFGGRCGSEARHPLQGGLPGSGGSVGLPLTLFFFN